MKCIVKLILLATTSMFIFMVPAFAIPEALPIDIGSNSDLIEVLNPEDAEIVNTTDTYLVSCIVKPNTTVTLYERLTNTIYVPMVIDDEAITGIVGESGIFAAEVTFDMNSVNNIMIFAQNGDEYESELRKIIIKKSEGKKVILNKTLNIKDFVYFATK